ncbi:P-loop containing nucleoside triphosphate hydrolase protein [Pleomassaria siparia CBS 279.74]|uniref:P-loop containing nucleoside triphosphate hydrolase protein n=1 Tax=Pleomassaria siparia CBS 279.74 TaxID=1314801 RepID=A0A6G1KGI8_9PLEO|nr:P-loop containing nucleoside triphosphate hydrolase protein [Pleomassaria siparia CBS 279.74]
MEPLLTASTVAPTVKHLFNGGDVCVFAYGNTGTGKTHTMRGGKSLADRGMIPRLLSSVYRRCRKIEKDTAGATQVQVALEYFEIYCDRVFDLFEPPEKRTPSGLPIRDNHGKTVIVGLTEKPCTTLKEFEHLYDQANLNRSTSATKLNAHSSRSHAILCVKVTQTTETTVQVSRASCIDLAGSEDNRRTDNNKERLVESSAINKSLFVLAQCVEAISKKQTRIPYRESKMTRILSLGQNNGLTIMILNIAPLRSYHLDTLSSLNFANRTKKIEICEAENEPIYRHVVKPLAATSSLGGANLTRQPLRPLTAAHNANLHDRGEAEKKKKTAGEKPVKAFSVYSDTRKPSSHTSNITAQNQAVRRVETNKRAADTGSMLARPSKTFRSTDSTARHRSPESVLSKEAIEALIAQRIDEKLAEKALQDAAVAAPALSEELQRRLDDLEHRIDAKDGDEKSQGLQFMLMAKQHRARGEDASALRMLQMALPFFPGNEKLKGKIRACEDRIRAKKEAEKEALASGPAESTTTWTDSSTLQSILPTSRLMAPLRPEKKAKTMEMEEVKDDDFAPGVDSEHDASYASDASVKVKKAARKPKKTNKKLPVFRDANEDRVSAEPTMQVGEQTPRTTQLLRIINSRDISQIKALKGVGTKKADAIVSSLYENEVEEVNDLDSLARLKGVGGRTVDNMRMGLSMDYNF